MVLEYNDARQPKTHTLGFAALILLFIVLLLRIPLPPLGYIFLSISITVFFGSIIFTFSKKGLIISNKKLFRGFYFMNILIFKRKIDTENKPVITILKFRNANKKYSSAMLNPDIDLKFNIFQLNLLNEKHTQKHPLLWLKDGKNAEKAVDFITKNFKIKHEIYCPNFD